MHEVSRPRPRYEWTDGAAWIQRDGLLNCRSGVQIPLRPPHHHIHLVYQVYTHHSHLKMKALYIKSRFTVQIATINDFAYVVFVSRTFSYFHF